MIARVLAGLALLVLLVSPAAADMFPDGSNAKLPATGTPNAAVCQVSGGKLAALVAGCVPVSDCVNIMAYGGVADGTGDNQPALTAALAASPVAQKCVAFPPGQFRFAAPFSYTYDTSDIFSSVTFIGSGAGVTRLIGPNGGNLFTFTLKNIFNSFHMRDLSLIATTPCSTCTALSLVNGYTVTGNGGYGSQNDITRVTITGSDASNNIPSGVNYWETGISLFGISNVNFDGLNVQGMQTTAGPTPGTSRGVYIYGDATHIPYVFNFANSIINLYSRAIELGAYFQGVTFANSNMVGNTVGFYVSSPVGTGAAQLSVSNSQLNSCSHIYVPGGGSPAQLNYLLISNNVLISVGMPFPCGTYNQAISLGGGDYQNIITNNMFSGATGWTGIFHNGGSYVGGQVSGNMFSSFGIGVEAGSSAKGILIDGNNFQGNTTAIQLDAAAQDVVVSNNMMNGNTTDLQNNTGNTFQNYVDIPQDCSAASYFTFGSGSAGITYSQKYCRVSIVNKQVFVDFDYTFSNKGTSTGQAQFQMGNTSMRSAAQDPAGNALISIATGMLALPSAIVADLPLNSSRLDFYTYSAGGTGVLTDTYFTNSSRIKGRASFHAP